MRTLGESTKSEWVALKGQHVVASGATSAELVIAVRALGKSGRGAIVEHRDAKVATTDGGRTKLVRR